LLQIQIKKKENG